MKRPPPKKKVITKPPPKKVPPKKTTATKAKYTCIACSDTGKDSRGGSCYVCMARKNNQLMENQSGTISQSRRRS